MTTHTQASVMGEFQDKPPVYDRFRSYWTGSQTAQFLLEDATYHTEKMATALAEARNALVLDEAKIRILAAAAWDMSESEPFDKANRLTADAYCDAMRAALLAAGFTERAT